MKKKLICLLVAGALPGIALADSTSAEIKALQAQAQQKQMKAMQAQLSAKGGPRPRRPARRQGWRRAAAVAIDPDRRTTARRRPR